MFQCFLKRLTSPLLISVSPQSLKAIVTPQSLLVLDFRGFGLERWLVLDLAPQLASQSHSLPFEFRALEAILQHKVRQSRETLCLCILAYSNLDKKQPVNWGHTWGACAHCLCLNVSVSIGEHSTSSAEWRWARNVGHVGIPGGS